MPPRGTPRRPVDWTGLVLYGAAALIVVACVLLPLTGAAAGIVIGAARGAPLKDGAPGLGAGTLRLFCSSAAWALGIGVLSTALACGAAWTMWRGGRVVRAAVLTPLLVPAYLAFAGWGLLRAPSTFLGAMLERAAERGWHDVPVIAGKALAVLGLGLWSFPLGAVLIWSAMRGTDSAVLDSLRVDGAGVLGTARELARMFRGQIVRSVLLVALVMLGSAVPLHLAQVETLAVQVWFALDNLPHDQHWRAWVAAWPLVLIAVAAGWGLGGRAARVDPGEVGGPEAARRWRDTIPGAAAWAMGVLVPLALFAANLGQGAALGRFWGNNGAAIWRSVVTASGVAVGTLVLSVASGRATSRRAGGRWVVIAARVLVVGALVPGVLVGSAFGAVVTRAGSAWLDDSLLPLIGAHLARFVFLGALAGCWGANAVRRMTGDAATLDGADGGAGWARAWLAPVVGIHAAAAGAAGVLSLHEIEAAVQVMPPGDCLARVVLGDLHYSRIADMSAAGIWLILVGLLPVAAVLATRRRKRMCTLLPPIKYHEGR